MDLLYSSNTDLLRQVGCDELGLSGHSLIYGVLLDRVENYRPTFRAIRCFRNCDWERLLEDLDSAPWQVMETMEDMDDRWEYWKQLFGEIVATHVPTKRARVRKKTLPWITSDIRALMRARNYFGTKAKKSKKTED